MSLLDIHTHHVPQTPGEAIVNTSPSQFLPEAGQYYAVGYHPWGLSSDASEDWELLQIVANHTQVLAIGEAGLDKLKGPRISLQEDAFLRQARIAEEVHKPLIIHCVRSFNEIVRINLQFKPSVAWIIHGFRGKPQLAVQLVEAGFYLSFGQYYQADSLRISPMERLFLETDEAEISILALYDEAAQHLSIPTEELVLRVGRNIQTVFGL